MRKTITVSRILEISRQRNAQSTCSAKVREGWNEFVEGILHETRQYNGFRYLTKDEVPKPGISLSSNGRMVFHDETRRYYF